MASTSININQENNSGYSLPAPLWRKGIAQVQTIISGENPMCDMYYPKIQLVNQSLIDDGVLYLQSGRISDKDYTISAAVPQIRENGIKWYTPYPNPFASTSGIVGGGDVSDGQIAAMGRTNLIPITNQFQTLSQAVPYWQFYRTHDCLVFNGVVSTAGITNVSGVPYMTGCKRRKDFYSPDQYLPGAVKYSKRPKRPMTRHRNMSTSTWFCRLIVIRDGRVEQVGEISTPIIVRPNELPFNENSMSSSPIIFGDLSSINYYLYEFKAEELTKYRK